MAIPFSDFHLELYSKQEPTIFVDETLYDEYSAHSQIHEFISSKWTFETCGQLFLYEKGIQSVTKSVTITYPKIGIFLNSTICDQTLEIEWAHYRRTWEYNKKFKYTYKDKEYTSEFRNIDTRVEQMILWQDDLHVYGVWDKLPDWKELRKSYEKTWWYHRTTEQNRDFQIQRILKHE